MRDDQFVRHNPQLMIVDFRICDSTPWLLYNEYRHIYRSLVSTSNEVHTLSEWTLHRLSMFALNNFEIEVATIPSRDTSTMKSHFFAHIERCWLLPLLLLLGRLLYKRLVSCILYSCWAVKIRDRSYLVPMQPQYARCCCLMPTCLFDSWCCIHLIYVCEDSPGALDLHVYLEIARVPLLHSFEWQIYFFATIRNCQPWDWPSLSVTFESIFCYGIWPCLLAIFWICLLREHITRLIISWLPFELVLEWFVLALAMHIYTNI